MIRILRLLHWPFWRQMPLQALLPALGIALGVAAILAIDLGSASTVGSLQHTRATLEGRSTHQIMPSTARPQPDLSARLRAIPGVVAAAPVVEAMGLGPEPLRLIGVDPFSEGGVRDLGLGSLGEGSSELFLSFLAVPGALLVSEPWLARQGLKPGDRFELAVGSFKREALVLAALPTEVGGLRVPDNLAVGDIATLQELTGRFELDRIDLVLQNEGRNRILEEIREVLPPGLRLEEPGAQARYLAGLLGALRANLSALSYLALFVSLFLIYNALLLAVLRRRRQLGIARCLGATRHEIWSAWMAEALLIGGLGTALGLVVGTLAGQFTMAGIAQSASDLYGYVRAEQLALLPSAYLKAASVGLIATLLAAAFPAAEAASVPPARIAMRGEQEARASSWARSVPLLALPLLLIFALAVFWPSTSPVPGYIAAVSLALAAAAMVPLLADLLLRQIRRLLAASGWMVGALAAENIRASMSRTAIAMAALTVALSMSIAMGTMVSSFRQELTNYIQTSVRADIYVSPATASVDREGSRLDPAVIDALSNWPGVLATDTFRGLPAETKGYATTVAGVELKEFRRRAGIQVLDGPRSDLALDRVESGQALVSEALANKAGIEPGDAIQVLSAGRQAELRVAAIYREYSSDRGLILLDRSALELHFGQHAPQGIALYLEADLDVDATLQELRAGPGTEWALLMRSNRALREEALEVFDRTFSIARSLELIGIAVAAIGILAALLAMLMERRRELATLRALGLTRRQLRELLLAEGLLMALISWFLALVTGSALAWILLRIINLRSFGWSLPFHLPFETWGSNLLAALVAAALASWLSLRWAPRISVATALRGE